MTMKGAVQGDMFSLDQAAYSSAYPPWARHYLAGYYIAEHLEETYGEGTIRRIGRSFASFPFFGFRHAVKRATGVSMRAIYRDMVDDLEKTYGPLSAASPDTIIASSETADYTAPIVTDAGVFAYRRDNADHPAIVLINPDSGGERPVIEAYLSDWAAFTATGDGETVVLSVLEPVMSPSGPTLSARLYAIAVQTGDRRRISDRGGLYRPALSPDGSALVALSKGEGYTHLVDVDLETGEVQVLLSLAGLLVFGLALF